MASGRLPVPASSPIVDTPTPIDRAGHRDVAAFHVHMLHDHGLLAAGAQPPDRERSALRALCKPRSDVGQPGGLQGGPTRSERVQLVVRPGQEAE